MTRRDEASDREIYVAVNDGRAATAMRRGVLGLGVMLGLPIGCVEDPEVRELGDGWDDEDERAGLADGVNGDACKVSPYNCKLRVSGGNRIATNDPDDDDSWAVDTNVPVLDGHGNVVVISTKDRVKFNYGQVRSFGGEDFAFAMSTSNSSAGWMPISSIAGEDSFRAKVGHVSAKGAGLHELGCYEVRNSHDPVLELKKVVYDSKSTHERAGDYLPLPRANGQRSVNLIFNVPGFALGGPAIDHFPAGTKFQRLDVPTDHGVPSIDIPLWVKDSHGRYRKKSGQMKFIYGYVVADTGTKRNGWMAYDALKTSTGCGGDDPEPPGDTQCCAKCWNRQAYHSVDGVTEGCTQEAAAWCDVGDRGGLEDAAWSHCGP